MRSKKYTAVKSLKFTRDQWAVVASKIEGRKWSVAARALILDIVTSRPLAMTFSGPIPTTKPSTIGLAGAATAAGKP